MVGCVCVIVDVIWQGVKSCQSQGLDALYVFVEPPSLRDLEARLRGRGTETEESLSIRLHNARTEVEASHQLRFDTRIVNDSVDNAYSNLRTYLLPCIEACMTLQKEAEAQRKWMGGMLTSTRSNFERV